MAPVRRKIHRGSTESDGVSEMKDEQGVVKIAQKPLGNRKGLADRIHPPEAAQMVTSWTGINLPKLV